jgi:hypothetical protein
MKEVFELRVIEEFAPMLLADDEGKRLGGAVRKIEIERRDPRFEQVGRLQRELREKREDIFFSSWNVRRQYSEDELKAATCFGLTISAAFEPAGEECGTTYDESAACPKCGAGAPQTSKLRLDLRRVPKNKDIARTIADEWIVSQRLAERMVDADLTGFELQRVAHKARYEDDPFDFGQVPTGREIVRRAAAAGALHGTWRFDLWLNRPKNLQLLERAMAEYTAMRRDLSRTRRKPAPVWYQLVVTSARAEIVPPTRVGNTPFDDDPEGECRCELGDTIGLNIISELSISAKSRGDTDMVCTQQFIGKREGLLRPSRLILVSPRFWRLMEAENVKGAYVELAHLV